MSTVALERGQWDVERLSLDKAAMRRRILLFITMIAAVMLVGIPLYVDARREAAAALSDFADDQAALASAIARSDTPASSIEQAGVTIVSLVGGSAAPELHRPDGTRLDSPVLREAMTRGERTVILTRPEAAAIGLPTRTAVAGIARRPDGTPVAVVATALRVRDREIRAQNRLILGIVLAALLVGCFGGIALRIQRKEHLLERELLVKQTESESEERLARADKLATMGALATGIAHEIATPLGVIAARTEMLAPRVASDERAARAAQAIIDQIEKIRGIIKSFLGLARGEAAAPSRLDARTLLASARAMVEHRFGAAQVVLDIDATEGDAHVLGDARLLEQAVVNLLLNACDASKAGQHVHARVRATAEQVSFCVEDDGAGINADVASRATEPFFTTKADGAGTGLGLAIVNEIAKHHQGRFVIGPRPGGGTEARLELPARAAPKERAA
jgi:two-component system NtrC family sensor kinase